MGKKHVYTNWEKLTNWFAYLSNIKRRKRKK